MTIKKNCTCSHHSDPTESKSKSIPNAILPPWLDEALKTPCPFCGDMPFIEIGGAGKSSFVCHSAVCCVGPETGFYPLQQAAQEWTRRAKAWAKLIEDSDTDLSTLDDMQLYGIAKRYRLDIVQLEPLGQLIQDGYSLEH